MGKSQELENLIKNMKDSMIISGLDGKLKYVSPQYSKLIGRDIKIGDSFGKSMHPDDFKRVTALFAQALKQGSALEMGEVEYRVKHKDGHYIWISTTTSNHYDEDGNIIGFLTTARDVSARKITEQKLKESIAELKKTEQKLRESEKKYRIITDNSKEAVFIMDLNLKQTFASPASYDMLGYTTEELIGMSAQQTTTPESLSVLAKAFKEEFEIEKQNDKDLNRSRRFEIQQIRKDGKIIDVEISVTFLRDSDDKAIGIVGLSRDISARKKAEEELKESEKKYRLITEGIKDVIWVMDMDFKFKYISPSIKELRGFTVEEAMNQKLQDMFPPKSLNTVMNLIRKELRPKKIKDKAYNPTFTLELEQYCKDGSTVLVEIKLNLIRDNEGKPYELMGISRDITARKKIEQKIIESEKKYRKAYKQANFYKDLFVHDISNIFNALYGYSQLYSEYQEEMDKLYDQEEMMKNMNRHIYRGVNLIKDVQKLSKLDNSIISTKKVNACDVLKGAIENALNSFPKKEIQVEFDISSKNVNVQANELLVDVFDNILNNAVKYNKNSPAEILIRINKVQEDNTKYVKIEFLDNGIGIMDELKQYTFKKGYKTEMKSKGMGFGLSIVKKILKSYNGRIWVENKVEGDYSQGCNFVVLIPESL